ncbi:hypothetical protein BV22DRAFT_1134333 [Leucogyrophana mollusca]|uniref:Uncharacterized protein n=1 Tax=Leucogyrophana mollusca TaxID=85980 RepID=A0ACB8AZV3_9AGAM|nr:hypothetical protein BV22DRAFT_1134333 [Leucogyrophana mollusca]
MSPTPPALPSACRNSSGLSQTGLGLLLLAWGVSDVWCLQLIWVVSSLHGAFSRRLGHPQVAWTALNSSGSSPAHLDCLQLVWAVSSSHGASSTRNGRPQLAWVVLDSTGSSSARMGRPQVAWVALKLPGSS